MKTTIGKTDKKKGTRAIEVGTYEAPRKSKKAYVGWVSPTGRDAQWLLYLMANGDAHLYTAREPDGAVTSFCQPLSAARPKNPRKEFHIDLTLYAHGKRRKASVGAEFPEGLRYQDEVAYVKLSKAAHEFCQHLIDEGEL